MSVPLVARIHLALAALVVLAGIAAGVALELELWSPGGAWSSSLYTRALGAHGLTSLAIAAPTIAGCCGYVVIGALTGTRPPIAAFAWIGLALWVVGLVAMIVMWVQTSTDTGWTIYVPMSVEEIVPPGTRARNVGLLAFGGAGLVYAGHLAAMFAIGLRGAQLAKLALGVSFVLAIAGASLASLVDTLTMTGLATSYASHPIATYGFATFAALVLATAAIAGDRPHRVLVLVAIACAAISVFTPFHVVGIALAGLWIACGVLAGGRRASVALVALGCVPALLIHSLARHVSAAHLHDTYFELGRYHALAAIIGFAVLASIAAWGDIYLGRLPHTLLTWIGGGLASAGAVLHIVAAMYVGTSGMPRRYWDYEPGFTQGHRAGAVGAAVAIVGVLVLVAAWIMGTRPDTRSRNSTL